MTARFEAIPNSVKVRCTICGRTGYGDLDVTRGTVSRISWQSRCLLPHIYECTCGKRYPNKAARAAHIRRAPGEHAARAEET